MKQLTFIMLLLAVMQIGRAQVAGTPYIGYSPSSTNTMGKDFWLTFTNIDGLLSTNTSIMTSKGSAAAVDFLLNITTDLPNTVTVSFTADSTGTPLAPRSFTYNLAAKENRRIRLDSMRSDGNTGAWFDERLNAYLGQNTDNTAITNNLSIQVTSAQPISLNAFAGYNQFVDATCIYPVPTWGTDYYNISYGVATFPMKNVIIANSNGTDIYLNNATTPAATLNAGQVYQVGFGGVSDITGYHVTTSKPAAFFVDNGGVTIVQPAQEQLYEQMAPVNVWDKRYFVPNATQFSSASTSSSNNRIRVVASQDNTQVNYAGATTVNGASGPGASTSPNINQIASGGTLNAGQFVQLLINNRDSGVYIIANNPIGVAGYLVGGGTATPMGTNIDGDPDQAVIPGLNQLVQQVTFAPFIFPSQPPLSFTVFDNVLGYHSAVIVTPTANKGTVIMTKGTAQTNLLTGTWIDDANGSGMSTYRYVFDNVNDLGSSFTVKSLAAGTGVFVLCYGLALDESYFYNAGSALNTLQ